MVSGACLPRDGWPAPSLQNACSAGLSLCGIFLSKSKTVVSGVSTYLPPSCECTGSSILFPVCIFKKKKETWVFEKGNDET